MPTGAHITSLLLEPIDSVTKDPIIGKVGTTIYNYPTETNPFIAPSQTWPLNVIYFALLDMIVYCLILEN